MDKDARQIYFQFMNEIGIIAQLSRAAMEARLPDGLILPHFSVINHLARVRDGQTPLALANAFQVPKTTMSHTLAGLIEHGFVEIRPNPEDGRSKTVWLTDAGRTFRQTAISSIAPDLDALSATIPADTISKMLPLLEQVREFMDSARN